MGTDQDALETKEISNENSFQKKYGWYAVIGRLANDDITKHNKITKIKLPEALNQLTFFIDKDAEEKRRYEAINRKQS